MQGRWTIYVCPVCGHAGSTDVCAGPRDHHELISRPAVPVVPCDGAAIDRVVAWLQGLNPATDVRLDAHDIARGMFVCAAGETP